LNEYQVLAEEFGYNRAGLQRLVWNAFQVCGAEPELKQRLLKQFDDWAEATEVRE
jgi:adenosine deaminase